MIEGFNRGSPEAKARVLQWFGSDPSASQQLGELLVQRQEQVQQLGRGQSR
jgi:hypothetical protein